MRCNPAATEIRRLLLPGLSPQPSIVARAHDKRIYTQPSIVSVIPLQHLVFKLEALRTMPKLLTVSAINQSPVN